MSSSSTSSSVVGHLGLLCQQSLRWLQKCPFYARAGRPVSSHLPLAERLKCFLSPSSNISALLLNLLRKVQTARDIYKERLSSTEPAGFRLRNSQLGAPVLAPYWLDFRSVSREHLSGESAAMVGGACSCVATYPMGA